MSDDNLDEDYSRNPVGVFGRLRNMKGLVWVVIISLVVLTVGASTVVFLIQSLTPGR